MEILIFIYNLNEQKKHRYFPNFRKNKRIKEYFLKSKQQLKMSKQTQKPKPKQGKQQQLSLQFFTQSISLQERIQKLVKQNLQQSIAIKKLTQQLTTVKQQQLIKQKQHKKQSTQTNQAIQRLQLLRLAQEEHLLKQREKNYKLQIDNNCLVFNLDKVTKDFDEFKAVTKQQIDELKRIYEADIKRHEEISIDYQQAINDRKYYLTENERLKMELKQKLQEFNKDIADKDRQKLQTVDFMKKEMYEKSKQLRTNLLIMKRDQMSTNTRLTMLQNQQLLEELEFQSKQTEKILKRSDQLSRENQQLRKQLQIESEVNRELAKRTTIAKKIIKNINDKQKLKSDDQNQHQNNPTNIDRVNSKTKLLDQENLMQNSEGSEILKKTIIDKDNLITALRLQLNKLTNSTNLKMKQFQMYRRFYEQFQPKHQAYLKSETDLRLIMTRFLQNLLQAKDLKNNQQNNQEKLKNYDQNLQYDLSRLKGIPVQKWTNNDIQITVKMLLTFVKPYFTMKHLKAQYFKYTKNKNQEVKQIEEQLIVCNESSKLKIPQINRKSPFSVQNKNDSKLIKQKDVDFCKNRKRLKKGKSMSTFTGQDQVRNNDKTQNKGKSTNISPHKQLKKQFSLHAILSQFKKSSHRQQKLTKKIQKSQSQHDLTGISQSFGHKKNNFKEVKFIYGQQIIKKNDRNEDKGEIIQQSQKVQKRFEFNMQSFKNKKSKQLIKSSHRQWGQKPNNVNSDIQYSKNSD